MKKTMESDCKCYMCDNLATTREHVPPLCLFPEQKDVKGLDYRKGLITVPSCEEHNSKKTKDDEFLMITITGIVGNNFLGYLHTKTKINRAIRRKSSDFFSKVVMKNPKDLIFEAKNGVKFPVILGSPDYQRLVKCFENIAYGLYFYEYKMSFKGQIKMLLGFLNYEDPDRNKFISFIKKRFEIEELALDLKGDNPDVFTYQFCKPDKFGIIGLKLTFYGATDVFVSLVPDNNEIPFDLGMFLLNKGLPIKFLLGDEKYEFNKNNNR